MGCAHRRRVVTLAGGKRGDDGEEKAQDVDERRGMDWDGAWRAFKRDFVGDDAKMPGDLVEKKYQNNRRAPDAEAKQQIYDDEDRVLNFATSQKVTLVSLIAVAALLFVFIVVIGPPPSDGRCTLPWCG
ncbi:predicted protein [Ostreococcus lucimarinus CCE9901]|uniref:Uncharacterized protein n=1 Tax=Ostreococcus lucimarinus (strain CCE9901) TaxID=436017 RepID=A4RUQ1_OSTLU|nr:predicted protein [Ostreococcus lucimarinus CCE9901]ABO95003.1 predicted protein [Ostreococcus lucimarinus CCE9901]|eukprot:XP_001416710.1 predicted protein [Ostreococcus lucimarinus CCE9901]